MDLRTGDPQRRAYQSEERLDLRLRPRRKIDGMNIPGANGFCGAKPGGAKTGYYQRNCGLRNLSRCPPGGWDTQTTKLKPNIT